ncbi:MAG: SAM-dependent chlorinase/fluorinase [Armatimonadota bacterium]|nr:SAM-dependent chlorinase/fluorinase [Armatimonadota bacterium]MDR5696953.1 SAM-dependent chlorinase/fluorinase [Armatimonadota bacterium]
MRIVTLLTDFGADSAYPAQMRGVILAPAPGSGLRVVDITHGIRRHDVRHGAYALYAASGAFPAGTVHVAVVDPGVGTERRALAVRSGGFLFVGPDNGLLMLAARAAGSPRAREIMHPDLRRPEVCATFHGRDIFAVCARWLALGFPFDAVGPEVGDPVDRLWGPPRLVGEEIAGEVIAADPFGNLATNIPAQWIRGLPGFVDVRIEGRTHRARVVDTYGQAEVGALLVLSGSDGLVEIAVREGSAAVRLGAGPGADVRISPAPEHAPIP